MSNISKIPSGIVLTIISAILFGLSTPFAKLLTSKIPPVPLAGLLYLGSGIGLGLWILLRPKAISGTLVEAPLSSHDIPWLAGSIIAGGMLAPVLLMTGLKATSSSTTALLLNLENVFTLLLAWFAFQENFDLKILIGVVAILCGSLILSWGGTPHITILTGPLLIAAACLAWAIDNNLTRKISSGDPVQIAAIKGLSAGITLLIISLLIGYRIARIETAIITGLLGLFGYGLSLVFFVLGLRSLGTARTAAYFSLAPFVGSIASFIILGEHLSFAFFIAALLMGIGIYFHISEKHQHEHRHDDELHQHGHIHDQHHRHKHDIVANDLEPHSHWHQHQAMTHSHPHYPDIHHRHDHH
jgi:drug/metabolite transporter (DMT)-like permease